MSSSHLEAGIAAFDEGRFFDAHEALEDLWRVEPDPELRVLWQGLVQVAVGLTHLARRNANGARTLLGRGLAKLRSSRAGLGGLDLAAFVAGIDACHAAVLAAGSDDMDGFDWSLVPSLGRARKGRSLAAGCRPGG